MSCKAAGDVIKKNTMWGMDMLQVVILCGGLGTRLKPKPIVEIGDRPVLWHIMNIYSAMAFKNLCLLLNI